MKRTVSMLLCLALLALGLTAYADSGSWDCPSCGREGNADNFCPACGTPRPDGEPDAPAGASAEALYEQGRAAYDSRDYGAALEYFLPAAEQGHADAQLCLGYMYRNGNGVDRDYGRAAEYFRLAAEQGNTVAQNTLGTMYENGSGVEQDYDKALEYYRLAADNGSENGREKLERLTERLAAEPADDIPGMSVEELNAKGEEAYYSRDYETALECFQLAADRDYAPAQDNLGLMYMFGDALGGSLEKDVEKALEYYRLAADQGYAGALLHLGDLYKDGNVVEQDIEKALEYYRLAADQGDVTAQFTLGAMYEDGSDVERDVGKAMEYYKLAADNGSHIAAEYLMQLYLEGLREKLGPDDESAAETSGVSPEELPEKDIDGYDDGENGTTPSAGSGDIPDLMQYLDVPMVVVKVGFGNDDEWSSERHYYHYEYTQGDLTVDNLQPFLDALENCGFRQVNYKYEDYISSSAEAFETWFLYCDGAPDAQTINVSDKKEKPPVYHMSVQLWHFYAEGKTKIYIRYSPSLTYAGNYAGEGYLFNGAERGSSGGGSSDSGSGSITFPTNETKTCRVCGGNKTRDCRTCGGKGYVENIGSTPQYSGIGNGGGSYNVRKTCPNPFCHNGQVDCSACGGTGQQR